MLFPIYALGMCSIFLLSSFFQLDDSEGDAVAKMTELTVKLPSDPGSAPFKIFLRECKKEGSRISYSSGNHPKTSSVQFH